MEDLSGALCAQDPATFDPDMHFHNYLKKGEACWLCDDAQEICAECPVIAGCFRDGVRTRESHMIRAGMLWFNGRPRDVRKRKA